MEYIPRRQSQTPQVEKIKKSRGKPKKATKNFEFTHGEHGQIDVLKQLDSYKKQLSDMQIQMSKLTGKTVEQEEQIGPIDNKKIEEGNILNAAAREELERKITQFENMLKEKETLIGAARATSGGVTECFTRNDRVDRRIIFGKLIKAKRAIQYGTHVKVSPKDKNKLIAEKKRLEKILMDTLPSMSDCNDVAKSDALAGYLAKHNVKYGHLMKKLQNINKILDPDNPSAGRLRYLWPD